MRRRNLHSKGLLFLLCASGLFIGSYRLYSTELDFATYTVGPMYFGTYTGVGILLTLGGAFLLGFLLYLVELLRIWKEYRVIDQIRRRRDNDL